MTPRVPPVSVSAYIMKMTLSLILSLTAMAVTARDSRASYIVTVLHVPKVFLQARKKKLHPTFSVSEALKMSGNLIVLVELQRVDRHCNVVIFNI